MSDVGLASTLAGITNILGILFLILCAFKKYYSWIILLIAHGSWFIFSLYMASKIDYTSLIAIVVGITALYYWRKVEYDYSTTLERGIYGFTLLIALGVVNNVLNPSLNISIPFNEIVFQNVTMIGLILLAFKVIDGWVVLWLGNFFYWSNTTVETILLILLGTFIYGYGFFNWRKDIKW